MEEVVKKQVEDILNTSGRATLSVLFPRDFEMYFCSLELTSGRGELIDYFSFPILPNSISKKEPYVSSIKKTFGGVTVLKNTDFIPQELVLRGNFGRTFKILGGTEFINFFGVSKFSDSGEYRKGTLSNVVKTGYGATKYLQGIIERSRRVSDADKGEPRILYFHNYTFGETYVVEPSQVQFDQSLGSNMMWNYSINFKVIECTDHGTMWKKLRERLSNVGIRVTSSALQSTLSSIGATSTNLIRNLI